MEIYSTWATVLTVISFFAFLGIVAWAYSGRRASEFAAAAQEPFALPDENAPARRASGTGTVR